MPGRVWALVEYSIPDGGWYATCESRSHKRWLSDVYPAPTPGDRGGDGHADALAAAQDHDKALHQRLS